MPPWFAESEVSASEDELLRPPGAEYDGFEEDLDSVETEKTVVRQQTAESPDALAHHFTQSASRSESLTSSAPRWRPIEDAGRQNKRQRLEVRLPKSTLVTPRSRYDGWVPPAPRARERLALASLLEELGVEGDQVAGESFIELELDNFSIYVDTKLYPCDLRPLQHLSVKGTDEFYFDGVLSSGNRKFYVERVAFSELPIGNYGTAHDSVDDQIWVRSRFNAKQEIYYKLKSPATEYERFHTPFLWIADLAKHVVDYCGHSTKLNKAVTLRHFQQQFIVWLHKTHKKSSALRQWHLAHGRDDFRAAVTANVDFIWKEVYGLLGHRVAHSLQLFREVKHLSQYRPFAVVLGDKRSPVQPSTIVTPYVYMCFGHSEFGTLLEPLWPLGEDAGIEITKGGNLPDFKTAEELEKDEDNAAPHTNRRSSHVESSARTARRKMVNSIKPGDTISTPPDGAGTGTKWRKELAKGTTDDHRWFGVVQRVHESPGNHARSFDVIWLYRPVDTPCGKMVYPWSKELFLSDHCTCEEGRDARVDEDEVLDCHNVDWFGAPETSTAEFFVRQTYQVEQRRWVALERDHMTCNHDKSRRLEYTRGDTVLACAGNDERTDVYEVVKVFRQGRNRFVRLQRLIRRSELQPHKPSVPPNELVYTEQVVVMKLQRILSKCIVRFFEVGEPIPCPYDRNGTANVFFVTHRLENGLCVPIPSHNRPTTMRQGFDPKKRVEKLRGLDLFCGSGNFGRGLEEGGVVDMRWTNDIWTEAIHTYMANASHHTKPFLGSVDDLLRCAIEGNAARGVPRRGEVDIISGGSPCQGFSLITNDKGNDRQKKNRSLVASFASFVDFYRPKYGVLENVVSIVQTGRGREEDAFSQLVCAIVGMGYQAQLTLGDAWSYGAPQSRSRVFLYFAAADQRLPEPPRSSHSHFDGVKSRGLGRMSNGEAFVSRSFGPTPFKFVSAAEATADIPDIQDAKPEYCVGYPDHRISLGVTSKSRHQYHQIPIQPYGMNFLKAWNNGHGTMTAAERELFPETGFRVQKLSQGWGRVKPNSVFHTITTCVTPTDARTGRFLHWHQDRPVTILEARRAQGFLDHEVLVGTPASQYELVGNSVARPMALALGLQFREALMGSLYDDRASGSLSADETHTVTGVSPMANVKVEGREEQKEEVGLIQRGLADDDDDDSLFVRDSPDLEGQRWDDVRRVDTPPTSLSGSEIKEGPPTVSRKRPLSSLALELEVSNVHNVEVELVHERHGDTEPRPRSPQTRLDGGTTGHLSAASAVEHEHDHVDADSGEVSPERGNWSRLLNEDSLRKGPST